MVEIQHVLRKMEKAKRSFHYGKPRLDVELALHPWPCLSTLVFTFDCEGTYGGGNSFQGETEVVPKLARLFKEANIQSTFNVLGRIAVEYPDIVKKLYDEDQDIAGHGYSHRYLSDLTETEQRQEFEKTISAIENACGHRIIGWRCPYGIYDKVTYDLMLEMGFNWSSNFGRSLWGNLPFKPRIEERLYDIIEIPFDDVHFDSILYRTYKAEPEQVEALWFNHAVNTQKNNSLFVLLSHPVNLADDEKRMFVIKSLFERVRNMESIWLASCGQVASRWRALLNIDLRIITLEVRGKSINLLLSLHNSNSFTVSDLSLQVIMPQHVAEIENIASRDYRIKPSPSESRLLVKCPEIAENTSKEIILKMK